MTEILNLSAIKKRLERFQDALSKKKLKAALISNPLHYRYLMGHKTESESQVFIPNSDSNKKPIIFTNALEAEMVKHKVNEDLIDIVVTNQVIPPKIKKELHESKYKELNTSDRVFVLPNSVIDALYSKKYQEQLKKMLETKEIGLEFPGWDGKQEILKDIQKNMFKTASWEGKSVILPRTPTFQHLGEILSDMEVSVFGIEFSHMNYDNFLLLQQALKKTNISPITPIDIGELLTEQRMIKDPDEIATIRQACKISDIGYKAGLKIIHEGGTELDVVAEIEYAMKKAGNEKPSFDTIVVSGYKSAWPHGHPDEKQIMKGESVTIDLGALYHGYCSDMTRTVVAGNESSSEIKDIFNIVNYAFDSAVTAAKPGIAWGELDNIVRKIFSEKNILEFYTHSLGHGVGIEVHEAPWISYQYQDTTKVLTPGMIITIEPGIYKPNIGGSRTENTFLITSDGVESLCNSEIVRFNKY